MSCNFLLIAAALCLTLTGRKSTLCIMNSYMAVNAEITKIRLNNTPMYVSHVQGGNEQEFFVINLTVKDFFQLKNNIEYYVDICELDTMVYIVKKKRTVIVSIISKKQPKECLVDYGKGEFSRPTYPRKLGETIWEVELLPEIINYSGNATLKRGQLCFLLRGVPAVISKQTVYPSIRTQFDDTEKFAFPKGGSQRTKPPDFFRLSVTSQHKKHFISISPWDFVIYTSDGTAIYTHKSILAARSKFFFEFLNENKEKEDMHLPGASEESILSTLIFLYRGKLKVGNLDRMLEMLGLAVKLRIQNLKMLCIKCVKGLTNSENVHKIREVAKRIGLEELVEASEYFGTI